MTNLTVNDQSDGVEVTCVDLGDDELDCRVRFELWRIDRPDGNEARSDEGGCSEPARLTKGTDDSANSGGLGSPNAEPAAHGRRRGHHLGVDASTG